MSHSKLRIVSQFCNNFSWRRNVATWSPLAFAFNAKSSRTKPLGAQFLGESTGLFGYDELQDYTGFYLLKEDAECNTEVLLHEAQNPLRQRKMVQIFDDLSDALCKVADLSEFIRIGHPDRKFAHAAKEASVSISNLVEKLNTNRKLYDSLRSVVEQGDVVRTNAVDDHVTKLFLFDFEQCGIHLSETDREKVVAYNDHILHVGSHFMLNSLNPRSVPKSQLLEPIRNYFESDGENVVVSGLFSDSDSEIVREAAYKMFLSPYKQQEQLLEELLVSRNKLASLCGFPTYADRAVKGSIAGNTSFVSNFLNILTEKLKPIAAQDYAKLLELKKRDYKFAQNLMPWDVPYYTAKSKQDMFNIKMHDYSPYFSLGACMDGLNYIFQELYGITLEVHETKTGELWHEDVRKLAVCEGGDILGYIYCDFFDRPGKPNQDCHFTIQGGRELSDGTYQVPKVVLMLTLPTPTWSAPSLLAHSMVDNLFHEMGHAMHSMLARTKYQHVTGTRCSTDLAEVPSVLMEYFASDPRIVSKFARHYKTGQNIPLDLAEKLFHSRRLFVASETQLQVFYAAFDQVCHGQHPLISTTELLSRTQNTHYGLPHVANTAWHLRFGHLVGYGAKYYSYLMSRAVASWIWQTCFQDDPLNRTQGTRYRSEVLAHGGSKPPHLLVKDFLRSEITPETLSDALLCDIENKCL